MKEQAVERGDFLRLFKGSTGLKYAAVVAAGLPIWYVIGVLITFSPEFGRAMGMAAPPDPGQAVLYTHIGLAPGGLLSGLVSQWSRNRRKVIRVLLAAQGALIIGYFLFGGTSLAAFYAICVLLGLTCGYWAVFIVMAAEQFGTNLRATATTTAPNFIRGALVPTTWLFQFLERHLSLQASALLVGGLVLTTALVALSRLPETYGRSLDFVE